MTTIRALLLGTLVGCASTPAAAHAYDVPPNCHFGGTYEIKLTLDHCESGSCEPGFREFLDLSDPNHPLDEHMQPTGEHCDETDAKGNPLEPHIYVTGNNGDDHCVLEWNRVCHLDGVFDSTIYIYGDQDIGDELWDVSFALSAKLVVGGDQFSGIYDGTATRPVDAPRWSVAPEPVTYSVNADSCETAASGKARSAWTARYPNAFPGCTRWSYNSTNHTYTANYNACPVPPQQNEAIYGNNYAERAWRWIGTVGAGNIYECHCGSVGGSIAINCRWVS